MAKQLMFDEEARRSLKKGIDILAGAVKDDAWSKGPQRRARQEVRCAHRHA